MKKVSLYDMKKVSLYNIKKVSLYDIKKVSLYDIEVQTAVTLYHKNMLLYKRWHSMT